MTAITDQQRDNVDFSLVNRSKQRLCEQAFDRSTWCLIFHECEMRTQVDENPHLLQLKL
jgi:hypothetical protein